MRLLGWLHHKVWQHRNEPFKDLSIGNYSTSLSAQSSLDDYTADPKAKGTDLNFEDESCMPGSDVFHGFLTIGTLGLEQLNSSPPTPTLPMPLEDITDGKAEVTKNDLKLINEELEKFIEAEADEEGGNDSLARSSYVSIVTLSGMQTEAASAEDYRNMICPLQGYLFGSSIELPDQSIDLKKEKVSLGELFCRTRVTEEISKENETKGETKAKQAHHYPQKLLKKIIKRFNGSIGSSVHHAEEVDNFIPKKKKLNKILKMFHRKVYPESFTAGKNLTKAAKYKADLKQQNIDDRRSCPGSRRDEAIQCFNTSLKSPFYGPSDNNSSRNRECWIKTDADYLVLEL